MTKLNDVIKVIGLSSFIGQGIIFIALQTYSFVIGSNMCGCFNNLGEGSFEMILTIILIPFQAYMIYKLVIKEERVIE